MIAFIENIDSSVLSALYAAREPSVVQFFIWVSELASTPVFIVLMTIVAGYLAYRRKWLHVVGLLAAGLGSGAVTFILKDIIARARPDIFAVPASGFAFPSGHAVRVVAFYGFLLFLTWPHLSSKWKKIAASFTSMIILAVGFSRLYLGVHYLSDVIAGYLIGALFVWIGIRISRTLSLPLPLMKKTLGAQFDHKD